MAPYDQRQIDQPTYGGQPTGQPDPEGTPPGGGYPGGAQQLPPISEMRASTPTLRWVTIGHHQEQVPIGPDDYVLDSVFNYQIDAWEVLVIVQPRDEEGEEEDDDEEEE